MGKSRGVGAVLALMFLVICAACGGTTTTPSPMASASISPEDEITPGGNTRAQVEADEAARLGPAQSAVDYTAQLDLAVGESGHMLDGTAVTLHVVEFPSTYKNPDYDLSSRGTEVVFDTEVEICAPPNTTAQADMFDLTVWLDNKTQATRQGGFRDPSLALATLPPGQCERGWTVWSAPPGSKPVSVTYKTGVGPDMIQWKLS